MPRKKKKKQNRIKYFLGIICIAVILIIFVNADTDFSFQKSINKNTSIVTVTSGNTPKDIIQTAIDETGKMIFYEIDVGNADCILVVAPDGETMLIDAGESTAYNDIARVLYDLDIQTIDYLVMTHPHADHIGSMDEIIENFDVETLIKSPADGDTQTYEKVMQAAEENHVNIETIWAGKNDTLGDVVIDYYNPSLDAPTNKDQNEYSIAMLLTYENTKYLCLGDIENSALNSMVNEYYTDIDCDIIKIAHHGSKNGTTEALLRYTSPDIAIIPCGSNNPYGHPHNDTLELLDKFNALVLRSDINGDILIISDGNEIYYQTEQ